MKKLIFIALIFLGSVTIAEAGPYRGGMTFNYFYSSLSPYGEWIQLDAGLYGWHPYNVRADWRPYDIGRWCWTDDGWYWDSYEPFGWAVYHYGRWYYDDYYGWMWVPDYEWAPAWVEWRYNDDYIGWAPLPPYATFNINFGIHFSIRWNSRPFYWNFVRYNHFCGYNIHNYLIDQRYVGGIYSRTRYRTNYYDRRGRIVNGGIDKDFVERRGGYRIVERPIDRTDNFDKYSRGRGERSDRIIDFTPSEREISRTSDIGRVEAKRYSGKENLRIDKITVERNNFGERNVERSNNETRNENGRNIIRSEREKIDINSRGIEQERNTRSEEPRKEVKKPEKQNPILNKSDKKYERPREVQPQRNADLGIRNERKQSNVQRETTQRSSVQRNERKSQPQRKSERPRR